MSSRDSILEEVYKSQVFRKIANKYISKLKGNADDFVGYCLLVACEMEESKLIKLYNDGQLWFYLVRIARNQCWNDKSDFNKLIGPETAQLYENNDFEHAQEN